MLTLYDHHPLGRRDFLRIGALAGLGNVFSNARLDASISGVRRSTSVILLFLHGGPSQVETFDPKMTAPSNIRSATGEIATRIPGVTYGSSFPRLAGLADRTAIVRSFTTGDGNHDIKPVVCRDTFGANVGSIYARVAGTTLPQRTLPSNMVLYPRAVDSSTQKEQLSFGDFRSTGSLGGGYAPVAPGAGGGFQDDLRLKVPLARLDDRRRLLGQIDDLRRVRDGATKQMNGLRDQALDTILGDAAEAFDLSREDPRTLARYDTAPLVRPEAIDRKWKNYDNYVDNAKTLGRLLLLARRLCERGCGFITVTTNFVWDMHADINNATMEEGMRYMGPPLDHALSAFIEDCCARGLDREILLVCCGEMGRTPRINATGGRDHWGELAPLLLFGGGLRMGQVIGASNREAGAPATDPITIPHLLGTILNAQFDVGQLRLVPGMPRDIATMTNYPVIEELF